MSNFLHGAHFLNDAPAGSHDDANAPAGENDNANNT
jgi:hypothetical protein